MEEYTLGYILGGMLSTVIIAILGLLWFRANDTASKYKEKYERELHFRKSSEVRLGKIGENLAPFLTDWPWSPGRFRFLGNPVDGIQFNDDAVVFVEIKTGGGRLSRTQKKVKNLIKEGKVRFVTFKIGEDGAKLIEE